MSDFDAEEVEALARAARKDGWGKWPDMLDELARRLRQDAEENKRDPASDPRSGDMVRRPDRADCFYLNRATCTGSERDFKSMCKDAGAVVVRRREVPQ